MDTQLFTTHKYTINRRELAIAAHQHVRTLSAALHYHRKLSVGFKYAWQIVLAKIKSVAENLAAKPTMNHVKGIVDKASAFTRVNKEPVKIEMRHLQQALGHVGYTAGENTAEPKRLLIEERHIKKVLKSKKRKLVKIFSKVK